MELATLSCVTTLEQARKTAENIAATLCTKHDYTTDDLLAAFEDGVNPKYSKAYPTMTVTLCPNVIDAMAQLVNAETGMACVILTKQSSLVVAPSKGKGYIVFNTETKRYDYTQSPEYDVPIDAASSVYLIKEMPKLFCSMPPPIVPEQVAPEEASEQSELAENKGGEPKKKRVRKVKIAKPVVVPVAAQEGI